MKRYIRAAKATDHFTVGELKGMISRCRNFGRVNDVKVLDNMCIQTKGSLGEKIWKLMVTGKGLQAYLTDKKGKKLSDAFIVDSSVGY